MKSQSILPLLTIKKDSQLRKVQDLCKCPRGLYSVGEDKGAEARALLYASIDGR